MNYKPSAMKLLGQYKENCALDEKSREVAYGNFEKYAAMHDHFETMIWKMSWWGENDKNFYYEYVAENNFSVLTGIYKADKAEILSEYDLYNEILSRPTRTTKKVTSRLASTEFKKFQKQKRINRDITWEEEKLRAEIKRSECKIIITFFCPERVTAKKQIDRLEKLLTSSDKLTKQKIGKSGQMRVRALNYLAWIKTAMHNNDLEKIEKNCKVIDDFFNELNLKGE